MGRKDAAKIAKQLIEQSAIHGAQTPVHILEAVSTPRERHWSSTLGELALGKADDWFNQQSPALIMVGQALQQHQQHLASTSADPSSNTSPGANTLDTTEITHHLAQTLVRKRSA